MLDFYLLDDSQPKMGWSKDLTHVGGIEDHLFFQLQAEGIIEPWFDYYSNFRWGSELVARMLKKLEQPIYSMPLQKQYKAFIEILRKAGKAKSGLLAFGD